jgi:hypothetical protein
MWKVAIMVAALGGASFLSSQINETRGCAVAMEFAPAVVIEFDSKVTFKCDRATPLDLIRAIGRQSRLPIGVVLGEDKDALSKPVHSYDLERVDVRAALEKAIEGTGYSLREENEAIEVIAGDLTPRQWQLLTHHYSGFNPGPNRTMVELGVALTMWMRAETGPMTAFASSIFTSTNDERFTLAGASTATTEEIADKIVSLGSKGMWIFRVDAYPPTDALPDEIVIEPYQHYSNKPNVRR